MYPLDQFQAKKWGCFCQWRSILTFWTYWKQLAHIYLTSNDITKRIFIPVYQYGHPKKEIHLNLQWYHRLCFFLLKKCNPKEFYPIDDHQHFNMELLCALKSLQDYLLCRYQYAQNTCGYVITTDSFKKTIILLCCYKLCHQSIKFSHGEAILN